MLCPPVNFVNVLWSMLKMVFAVGAITSDHLQLQPPHPSIPPSLPAIIHDLFKQDCAKLQGTKMSPDPGGEVCSVMAAAG